MPYITGTKVRIDVIMEIFAILMVVLYLLSIRKLTLKSDVAVILKFSFVSVAYITIRIMLDFDVNLKIYVYQIHVLAGICIYELFSVVNKNYEPSSLLKTLIIVCIPINLLCLAQWFYPNSDIVQFILLEYGGAQSDEYNYAGVNITNLASVEVMHGAAMTSLFSGKHTFAQFALMTLASSLSYLKINQKSLLGKLGVIASLVGGFFTFSKIFIFGLPIFYLANEFFYSKKNNFIMLVGFLILCLVIPLVVLSTDLFDRAYVLKDIFTAILSGNALSLVNSRFGEDGYLTEYNYIFLDFSTWIIGQGASAGDYKVSDNQYRSLILIGGLPYLLLFMYPLLLIHKNVVRFSSENAWVAPFAAYGVVILLSGLGAEVFWQPRITSLWIFFVLLLGHAFKSEAMKSPILMKKHI